MNNIKLLLLGIVTLFILWLASWFGLFGAINSDKVTADPAPKISHIIETASQEKITLKVSAQGEDIMIADTEFEEGTTAFSLLEKTANENEMFLATTQYDFGVFVNAIGDLQSNNEKFWKYYVNGEEGSVAADNYTLSRGDRVEWVYEDIKN